MKLGDRCHIAGRIGFRGYTKDDLVAEGEGAITLSPSNIVDGITNYDKCAYISWVKYDESPEIKVENGDILLVKTGSSYGKCALVEYLPEAATINPQFVVLKHIGINEFYLTFLLQSNYAKYQYDNFVLGTAIPTFTQEKLGNMMIPIPPLREQEKIASVVRTLQCGTTQLEECAGKVKGLITKIKTKILDLAIHGKLVPQNPDDEPAAELLRCVNPKARIITDNPHCRILPSGWCNITLGELCTNINGLWKGKKEPFVNIGVIRNANFTKDFRLDYSKIEYIDVEIRAFTQRYLLNGDLIVEKSGGSDNSPVGRAILYEGDNRVYSFSNFTMALRPKFQEIILSKHLYYYILFRYKQGDMKQMQTQTTGLHNLIMDKYLGMEVMLPPLAEQKRIIAKIEELFAILDEIGKSLEA